MIRPLLRHLRLSRQLGLPFSRGALFRLVQDRRAQFAAQSPSKPGAHGLVFSFNRALQLYGLLESYFTLAEDPAPLSVIYRATGEHQRAYEEVAQLCADWPVTFFAEQTFRATLLERLAQLDTEQVFCLVDDIFFTAPFSLAPALALDAEQWVFSLRHGKQLTYCYMAEQPMKLPPFIKPPAKDLIAWNWRQGEYDWNYPLSVDGHLFDRHEFAAMAELIPFKAPNSFEHGLQIFRPLFLGRKGAAFETSRQVNVPYNKVQDEFANKAGALDPEQLLGFWNQGKKLDVAHWRGHANSGVHEDLPLQLADR